jgi:uncharacterized protein
MQTMDDSDFSAVKRDAVLNIARQQRAEHLLALAGGLRVKQHIERLASRGFGIWLFLAAVSLFWVAPSGHDNGHGLIMMVGIAVASLVSSIAGFAFSAICGAILFHISDDPVQIVQIMMTCSIANQLAMTWAARNDIDWRGLDIYVVGGLAGLGIGVWILLHVDRVLYTRLFGILLLVYGGYMLVRKPVILRRQPRSVDFITGFLGGITGGAAGFPAAFVTIWCGMKGWDKTRQRAVFQPFILIMQMAALPLICLARGSSTTSVGFDFVDLAFIPGSLIGTSLGLTLYRRLTDRQFALVVNVLLVVSGASYVV